ncbi:TIGR02221 family CRISPR-associated protein [Treponema sp. OMZ 787]|uniref:TIGR02221 family CRISPR-associated protein n=1 Tax=Treponema sp. OMZ 787 TaxID=2563669 RepID=UPI0020A5ABEF|nr:TIGR02221 family CRISPR-associated protein [Treponema sp. OMZ 787]UTC61732.1 TIGR02221 family CRISPR-associated protein [Treponema sp. OMZ 787]
MARKFISFLGTSDYKYCSYTLNNITVNNVRFIQEALIRILCEDFSAEDGLCFMLTAAAKKKHWEAVGGNDKNLEDIVNDVYKDKADKPQITVIDIPDGKSEEEIWFIFQKITDLLNEDDSVIFDITHGFRSLPMLAFAVLNYASFLKNIKLEGIYYGAYEAKENENAPIFNLTEFYSLLRWSSAADAFVSYGYSDKLFGLIKETARNYIGSQKAGDNLKDAVNTLNTVRGKEITEGKVFSKCITNINDLRTNDKFSAHPAFEPLFDKINDVFSGFKAEDPLNFLYAAKLHLEHGREQQAITLLQEGIITAILQQVKFNFEDRGVREITSKYINQRIIEKRNHTTKPWLLTDDEKKLIQSLEQSSLFAEVISSEIFDKLTGLRNDINHGGYNKSSSAASKIISNVKKHYEEVEDICKKCFAF